MFLYLLCVFLLMDAAYAIGGDTGPMGRDNSEPGWFPYVVSLRSQNQHICGGAIIDNTHILTAGHCLTDYLYNPCQLVAVTSTIFLNQGGEIHRISAVYISPDYDMNDEADIGVVKLSDPITYNAYQKPIAINTDIPTENDYGLLVGWGEVPTEGRLSNNQQYQYIWILSLGMCRIFYPQEHGYHICTSTEKNYAVCGGDSGSPLVHNDKVIGIASRGDCKAGRPDLFTTVYHNQNFINDALAM